MVRLVDIESFDIVVLFSKKNVPMDLIKSFNSSLKQLKANGSLGKIMKKYVD